MSGRPLGLTELKSEDQKSSEGSIQPCHLSSSPRSSHNTFYYSGIASSRQHYIDLPQPFSERYAKLRNLKVKFVQNLTQLMNKSIFFLCLRGWLNAPLPPRSHFSLSLKTHSPFGLIFYVSDVQEYNFMALFLDHGKVVYTFNVAEQRVKVMTTKKYNDGAWHNVSPPGLNMQFLLSVDNFWSDSLLSHAEGHFYSRWKQGPSDNWRVCCVGRHSWGKWHELACQQSSLCWRSHSWKSPEEHSGTGSSQGRGLKWQTSAGRVTILSWSVPLNKSVASAGSIWNLLQI